MARPRDRSPRPPGPGDPPEYTRYRAGRRILPRRSEDTLTLTRSGSGEPPEKRRRPAARKVVKWVLLALAGWILLSVAVFLISAQIESGKVSDDAKRALDDGGYPLTAANTILVLGSDLRTAGTKEPGAVTKGPSRSDSILLMRVGSGHSARLAIPRDTVVDIPGHGRNKINAAYAFGGAALAIETVKQYLGIEINHVVEVSFNNFPDLIDALGGVNYTGGCVVSRINGGFKNGGYTLRLKRGTTHLNGKQALALARTRKNDCNKRENDLTRARRQQKLVAAMKGRLLSPTTFIRMPWVAWAAPKALRSDMGGISLLGLFAAMETSGSSTPRVLLPSGGVTLPDGGAGLEVSETEKQAEVARFLKG
jgi:LCP family protein required for cell wall assembly